MPQGVKNQLGCPVGRSIRTILDGRQSQISETIKTRNNAKTDWQSPPDRQTDRQKERQTNRQTVGYTDRQIDKFSVCLSIKEL